jgi:hypothetical protein
MNRRMQLKLQWALRISHQKENVPQGMFHFMALFMRVVQMKPVCGAASKYDCLQMITWLHA